MQYKAPRGTADILPEEQKYWRYIEQKALEQCRRYGYQRLDTPVFEDAGLFTRSIGEGTDIVTKEMYIFDDRSDNRLALRPEGTAPICRAYVEHGMGSLTQPVKLFYLANIFRYERPQAGRYREHHQFGCEAIGESDPAIDAEVVTMAWSFFASLGLNGLMLKLNSIGCKACRPAYLERLREYYISYSDRLCPDCKVRMEKNTLRLLDCKQPSCHGIAEAAPRSADHLCKECNDHFTAVRKYLNLAGVPFEVSHRLVRGLDYYTRTVFEIQPPGEGAQTSVGGGGRYDGLIEEIGGKPTPSIGFGTGIERIVLNLKAQSVPIPPVSGQDVFIAYRGDDAKTEAVRLAAILRSGGIGTILAFGDRSLKAQMRQADGSGCAYVAIIGDDELQTKSVTLRTMGTGEQQSVLWDNLVSVFKSLQLH